MAEQFNLSNYTHDILKMSTANNCKTPEVALQCFVANLATMKEHYEGCPDLNFHELGQHWNRLTSKERNSQKAETLARLSKYPRSGGKS